MSRHNHPNGEQNSSRLTRRGVLGASGAALAAGLSGCAGLTGGGTSNNDSSADGETQIDYWFYFGAAERDVMANLITEFNEMDNGIQVNEQGVPFGEFLNKLFTAVNADNSPHVASYFGSFGQYLKPITHPIDDYLSSGASNKYFDFAWDSLQVSGSTYALPIDIHGKALYTNENVLESAGVDPDFTSWESFSNACDTIVSDSDARPFSFLNWRSGQEAFRAYTSALTQAGGNVLTGDPGNYQVAYDNDIGLETAQLMANITGEFGWDTPTFQSDSARVEDFIAGNLAMFIAGTWSINNLKNESGEVYEDLALNFERPFMFPGDGDNVAWCESNSLFFPNNANHDEAEKQAAVEFAEFVTQNNAEWATAGGHLPASQSVAESSAVKNTALWQDIGTISTMHEMVTNEQVRYQPSTSVDLNSSRFWGSFLDMYLQNTDVQTGVQSSASELQSALDNA
ncbi:extracellular solute-binding protein [Haloarcula sp. Atlit-120R]|uniref:extracellular solute-binding protein n=1 Tax=Haloarcula sp. Atlit-120R TaxID=2282135 RepID=UPI000EF23C8E|nr:extracellular solute-binding protein [Haloarcula sp. Atlit-120R]RLM33079.1 extracellular solute-binding protein [Haloarcula sp. Atlit-120R]